MKEFFELVKKMREAQNAYFKNRTQSNLIAAKTAEKKVDEVLLKGYDALVLDAQQAVKEARDARATRIDLGV